MFFILYCRHFFELWSVWNISRSQPSLFRRQTGLYLHHFWCSHLDCWNNFHWCLHKWSGNYICGCYTNACLPTWNYSKPHQCGWNFPHFHSNHFICWNCRGHARNSMWRFVRNQERHNTASSRWDCNNWVGLQLGQVPLIIIFKKSLQLYVECCPIHIW